MNIVISGASGLLGRALTGALTESGHRVRRLVRRAPATSDESRWDPSAGVIDPAALEGSDVVVNLSGAGIGDRRWTQTRKNEIAESRLGTTRLLAETMAGLDEPPGSFIAQSAIGYYGNRGDEVLTESSGPGNPDDFLTDVSIGWEAAADAAREAGIRVVHPRTGLVLAAGEQLLGRLVPLFRMGMGGPIGDGTQWWSWIALDDHVAAMRVLIEGSMEGPVNLVAPHPVTNAEFTQTLAGVLSRPALVRVPRVAMRSVMWSERADGLTFSSTRVAPERLLDAGFPFRYPDLETALRAILDRPLAG